MELPTASHTDSKVWEFNTKQKDIYIDDNAKILKISGSQEQVIVRKKDSRVSEHVLSVSIIMEQHPRRRVKWCVYQTLT